MRKIILTAFIALTSINSCQARKIGTYSSIQNSSSLILQDLYAKNLIEWDSLFLQAPNKYYVYVFSYTCYYCNKIKNEVNMLANCAEFEMYFVEFIEEKIPVKGNYLNTIGCNDINSLYISGTPTLFIIDDSSVYDCYLGYEEVKNYISLVVDIN